MKSKIQLFVLVLIFGMTTHVGFTYAQTQRNPVLEEFTGTWCPWCPCGHVIMEEILHLMPNAIMIGYHGGGGGDPFQNFPGNAIVSMMNVPFWPSGTVDRTGQPDSRGLWEGQMNQRYNVPATVAISVNRTYSPVTRELGGTVDVTALENLTGTYRLTIILLEDGLVYSQAGNTSCTGGTNYVHKHVVREMINGPTGEDLNGGNPWGNGEVISKNIHYTVPNEFVDDSCHLVFLVHRVESQIYNSEIQQGVQTTLRDPDYVSSMSVEEGYHFGPSSDIATYNAYLKNKGMQEDTYVISLNFVGPNGWVQSFTTDHGTFNSNESDTLTLSPGDSTAIEVSVNANSINGYGRTTLMSVSFHDIISSTEMNFTTFGLNVLVVDGDGGENYEEYIVQELDSLNYEYGIIPRDYIPINSENLNTFNILVWNCALAEPVLNNDEMNALRTYLDNGGNLYLNGVDIAYQLADPTSPYYSTLSEDFFTNYLHSTYILREHSHLIAESIAGDPITDGMPIMVLTGGTGASTINFTEGHYVNQIAALGDSAANIQNFNSLPEEHPAIRAVHEGTTANGRIVFTAYGFETIASQDLRTDFTQRILNWLDLPTGAEQEIFNNIPDMYSLNQNYPNPFNPSTKISYTIPVQSKVSLKVFDVLGREVTTLVDEVKNTGRYQVEFDASDFSSGIYFYQLKAGDYNAVRKMSVVK